MDLANSSTFRKKTGRFPSIGDSVVLRNTSPCESGNTYHILLYQIASGYKNVMHAAIYSRYDRRPLPSATKEKVNETHSLEIQVLIQLAQFT